MKCLKKNIFFKLKKILFFLHLISDNGKFRFRFSVRFWTEISAETERLNDTKTETEMHTETEISAEIDTETESFRSLDQIVWVPFAMYTEDYYIQIISYCYYSVNDISSSFAQSGHIRWLLLSLSTQQIGEMWIRGHST